MPRCRKGSWAQTSGREWRIFWKNAPPASPAIDPVRVRSCPATSLWPWPHRRRNGRCGPMVRNVAMRWPWACRSCPKLHAWSASKPASGAVASRNGRDHGVHTLSVSGAFAYSGSVARKDRMLPLSPGRAESPGFEYKRKGTLSLFPALNTATARGLGKTAAPHTSEQFFPFLTDIGASQCERQEIHVICDNVSSHKTQRVRDFLVQHGNVRMHFTPTYSSWLNQVENWFSRIQRDVITRGVFTSVKDLGRKLMRYIREHNKNPKPIKWKYDDPSRRIRQVLIQ